MTIFTWTNKTFNIWIWGTLKTANHQDNRSQTGPYEFQVHVEWTNIKIVHTFER